MIIRFFRNNQTSSIFLVPFIGLMLWFYGFIGNQPSISKETMPLYELVLYFTRNIPILNLLLGFFLLIFQSYLLNKLVDDFNLLGKRTNLPALLYIVCMSSSKLAIGLHPMLFVNLFLLLSFNIIYFTYKHEDAFVQIFISSIFLSLASLFYFPSILFFILFFIFLLIFRNFNWREWVISLLGLLLPYFFVLSIYYLMDLLGYFLIYKLTFKPIMNVGIIHQLVLNKIVLYGLFFLVFVLSGVRLIRGLPTNTVVVRKIFIANAWLVFFSVLIATISGDAFLFCAFIPLSIYFSYYFISTKKVFVADLIFSAMLLFIVINQYF